MLLWGVPALEGLKQQLQLKGGAGSEGFEQDVHARVGEAVEGEVERLQAERALGLRRREGARFNNLVGRAPHARPAAARVHRLRHCRVAEEPPREPSSCTSL